MAVLSKPPLNITRVVTRKILLAFRAMNVRQLFDLSGKTAIVTGGSRGLGLQIAEALGEMGARIAISARKQDELDAAVAHLKKAKIDATAYVCDIGQARGHCTLRRYGAEELRQGRHPGEQRRRHVGRAAEEHPLEAWDKLVNVNLTGVFVLTQLIGKKSMIPAKWGRVVNVASIAGLMGQDPRIVRTIAYNATKGGLVNFTRALAAEWGQHGITVNAICPGFFPSRMTKATLGTTGELIRDWTPTKRLGNDET
jgi:gluconate 5-dehydrogenase